MSRRLPRSTRTDTRLPYTTLVLSPRLRLPVTKRLSIGSRLLVGSASAFAPAIAGRPPARGPQAPPRPIAPSTDSGRLMQVLSRPATVESGTPFPSASTGVPAGDNTVDRVQRSVLGEELVSELR